MHHTQGEAPEPSVAASTEEQTIRRFAAALAIPGALISIAACFLIPWMIETKRRLQNDYWEMQLLFAMSALGLAAVGFPLLFLRLFYFNRVVSIGGWVIVLMGHAYVFLYIIQSHFPLISKGFVGLAAAGLASVTLVALGKDWRHRRATIAQRLNMNSLG
jgi:hypothetical protein